MHVTRTGLVIDLNADLGEHDGDGYARDLTILDAVSSASISCGAHAGSVAVMTATIRSAAERGVSIGAHPGYPDRASFGRQESGLALDEIVQSLEQQLDQAAEACARVGARLRYIKPHGAMYNRSARDAELAAAIAGCVASFRRGMPILVLPDSESERAAESAGLVAVREAFIDRAYRPSGSLVSRDEPDAVIDDPTAAARRAVVLATSGGTTATTGEWISLHPRSLCAHGDSPNAPETIALARKRLIEAGVSIQPFAT